nr:reverse transcriptase domain-containing protein [Tanacetum cinerariifolium]
PARVLRQELPSAFVNHSREVHQEKVQQEKLKALKARLNFEEASQHSESGTPSRRRDLKKRLGSRHIRSTFEIPEPRRGRSESPKKRGPERKTVFKRLENGVFHRLGDKGKKNYLQQKKCIKDPVKIHNIKQRDGEFMEEFVRRYKLECMDVKGAPKCMKISRFMHGITNSELTKRLHDKILKSVDKMMRMTTAFLRGEEDETKGPMIIEAEMGGFIHCINQMVPASTPLVGFSREIIWPLGQTSLLVKIGDEEHLTFVWMNFMVVRSPSLYNGIIGRPRQDYSKLKFTMVSGPGTQQPIIDQVTEEKIQVAIHPEYSEQTIAIGSTLIKEGRKELCGLLRRNLDIFAWKPEDMTGVPRHIAEHRDGKQVPIYFISRALQGLEISYTPMEKLILALSFELEEHDIHYRPRTSVKGQILVDFIVERLEYDPSDTPIEDEEELSDPWILFTDESSCIDGSGSGLILTNPEGMEFTYALRFRFDATSNKAEYEALIASL